MAGERKCAKCRFFKDAGIAGNGWCTQPKRQHTTDNLLLVRAGELACRNDWGGDLFQSRDEQPIVTDGVADLPGQVDQPAAHADDEVTSVITRPAHASRNIPPEDRVVSDRPAASRRDEEDEDTWNDAAHREQEERARIIARGSRDALMHARERHSSRRSRAQQDPAIEPDRQPDASPNRVTMHQARFTDRARSRHTAPSYGGDPVPRAEVESRQKIDRERFESVPTIDPNVDLPGWRASDPGHVDADAAADDTVQTPDPTPAEARTPQPGAYESVLQRARRTREQRTRSRQARQSRPATQAAPEAAENAPLPPANIDQRVMAPDLEPSWVAQESPEAIGANDLEPIGASRERIQPQPVAADPYDDGEPAYEEYLDEADPIDEQYLPSRRVEAGAAYEHEDLYDDWHEDEPPAPRHQPRQRGWLSRLGLGRRNPRYWPDEAAVTRHAEPEPDDEWWDDVHTGVPQQAAHEPPPADEFVSAMRIASRERTFDAGRIDDVGHHSDAAYDNTPRYRHEFDEDELAPIPGPVPAPRQRQAPMHRQRMARELPDLDDNLFEERFDRPRYESQPARAVGREEVTPGVPIAEAHGEPASYGAGEARPSAVSSSPRDSFFRAAKYRGWAEAHVADPRAAQHESDVDLPDLAEHDFDLREVVARGGELMDMTIDIVPEVPRECRTCRSFRSADGGARGWCTNEWAFTHRRMVNEDDLACDSTVGCWWLPADRYWLIEEQDGFTATPRMDELIARLNRPHSRDDHDDRQPERQGITG